MPSIQVDPSSGKKVPGPKNQVKLYWPEQDREIWETFVKACDRDRTSASEQIRLWVRDWYKAHAPGNPQTPLEKFEQEQKTQLHSMTLVQLEELYEALKAVMWKAEIPAEQEVERLKQVWFELENRRTVLRKK